MTVFLGVTDAIGASPNHGITRTERQLARALAAHDDVSFVVMHHGQLWQVDTAEVMGRLERAEASTEPVVEIFGVTTPVTAATSTAARVRARLRQVRAAPPSQAPPIRLERIDFRSGDALVSAGLDWVHGLLGEAERVSLAFGVRYFGFCYDLIPIDHPEWLFPADSPAFRRHFERATRCATAMLCISQSTRADLLRHYPEFPGDDVHVLPLGADAACETSERHVRFARELFGGEPYAVYCATIDRRKNHQLLYRAAKEMLREGLVANFVFVGMVGNGVDDLIDSLRSDPAVAGRFVHVTQCDDEHLAAIYQRARFAVYPSLYEGWGLGVTEALIQGTPCIVASGSSLGEAGLGICRELHPLRTQPWVEAMTDYFASPPSVPSLKFPTWADTGSALMEVVAQ